jgi:hypothetical protein
MNKKAVLGRYIPYVIIGLVIVAAIVVYFVYFR